MVSEKEEIVGFLVIKELVSPIYPMFKPKKYAYILDLVVKPDFRNKGYSKQLFKNSVDWARIGNLIM